MSITPTYPGVYIQELPSAVHTITGVATSITAFVGRALRGDVDTPTTVFSFADFERSFGGLWLDSTMSYAVQQFFLNGGSEAVIVRVQKGAVPATITLTGGVGNLVLAASDPGSWGNGLRARVDWNTRPLEPGEGANTLFNLTVKDTTTNVIETFLNVSVEPQNRRYVLNVLKEDSALVVVSGGVPAQAPTANAAILPGADPFPPPPSPNYYNNDGAGLDGVAITDTEVTGVQANKTGIFALDNTDLFNLLCIPPLEPGDPTVDVGSPTITAALSYCKDRRAILILDSPNTWNTIAKAVTGASAATFTRDQNSALYFPRVRIANPLRENRLEEYVPCGVVAGVIARIDATRGVWKAPAGQDATMVGVSELTVPMTDPENGLLNPLAVNCLRTFPVVGNVVWGARTLRGADVLADQWKYLPVRRTALYIEESLYRGTKWAVFEPNDEPLWAQLRLNVGAFMQDLFRKGAFQGSSPKEAYLVKCDSDTTTQNDIDLGIVNILVGFAPLKPAEFVILKIEQLAGKVQI